MVRPPSLNDDQDMSPFPSISLVSIIFPYCSDSSVHRGNGIHTFFFVIEYINILNIRGTKTQERSPHQITLKTCNHSRCIVAIYSDQVGTVYFVRMNIASPIQAYPGIPFPLQK